MYEDLIESGLIGTDEAGKGDYFGPLVCAACYLNTDLHDILSTAGIRDSKKISNGKVKTIAAEIKKYCPYNIIVIGPEKYNQLYAKIRNLNKLLAWAHAKTIENLLQKVEAKHALIDKFGDERLVEDAFQGEGKNLHLIQVPKAEANPAVAAASVLARAEFLWRIESLSKDYDIDLRRGAGTPTDNAARLFIIKHGAEKLPLVAKYHFRNTKKVLG